MSIMRILKDIKISKDRLPVQNALWIRPMGGLSFKLYVPSGVDWKEVGIDNRPSPSPTPSKTKKGNCDGGKVIVGKCIPKYPMVGDRYYFADGIIKFKKSKRSYGQWTIMRYNAIKDQPLEDCSSEPQSLCVANEHLPVVVTITKAGLSCMDNVKVCKVWEDENRKTHTGVETLTCDTTSPYFKIINGQLRHIIPEDLGDLRIPSEKFKYIKRWDVAGHESRKLTSGWALMKLKTKRPSHNGNSLQKHSSAKRRVIKLYNENIAKRAKTSGHLTSSILVRKIAKRRISNTIRATLLSYKVEDWYTQEKVARITTHGRRI